MEARQRPALCLAEKQGLKKWRMSPLFSPQEKLEEGEVLAVGAGRFVEDKDSKEKVKKKTFVKTTPSRASISCTKNTPPEK